MASSTTYCQAAAEGGTYVVSWFAAGGTYVDSPVILWGVGLGLRSGVGLGFDLGLGLMALLALGFDLCLRTGQRLEGVASGPGSQSGVGL